MSGRWTAASFLGLLALVAAWFQGVYLPLSQRLEDARAAAEQASRRLGQVQLLEQLQRQLEPIIQGSATGDNLMTRLAARIDQLGLKARMQQMRTQPIKPGPDGTSPVAEAAYLRFDNLDMKELGTLLQDFDHLERDVWVQKMDLRLMTPTTAMVVFEIEELRTE